MSIRGGKLTGSRAFSFTGQEFPDAELLSSFVGLYYDLGASPPDEVLLPIDIEDAALKAEWLTRAARVRHGGERRRRSRSPSRSGAIAASLIELAQQERGGQLRHAPQRARRHRAGAGQAAAAAEAAAAAAGDRVLRRLAPAGIRDRRVDGGVRRRAAREVALPHLQGARARRAAGTPTRHNDDFASMYEVLSRRFRRARRGAAAGEADAAGSCPT